MGILNRLFNQRKRIAELEAEVAQLRKDKILLQESNSGLYRDLTTRTKQVHRLAAKLAKVKNERDAAIRDLMEHSGCPTCKHEEKEYTEEPCCSCGRCFVGEDKWEWRGATDINVGGKEVPNREW